MAAACPALQTASESGVLITDVNDGKRLARTFDSPATMMHMNARELHAGELDLALPAEPKHEDFADIQTALRTGSDEFPFRCELSLEPLIAFWTRTAAAEGSAKAALGRIVADELRGAP